MKNMKINKMILNNVKTIVKVRKALIKANCKVDFSYNFLGVINNMVNLTKNEKNFAKNWFENDLENYYGADL